MNAEFRAEATLKMEERLAIKAAGEKLSQEAAKRFMIEDMNEQIGKECAVCMEVYCDGTYHRKI